MTAVEDVDYWVDEEEPTGWMDALDNDQPTVADRLAARRITSSALAALPPPAWIIHGLVPTATLVQLYGPSGGGKSFTGLTMAASIALGRPWFGLDVAAGSVLYIAAESPAGMGRRLAAWCDHEGVAITDLDGRLEWIRGAVNLYDAVQVAALANVVRDVGAAVVIVDTLARCSVGAEENSAKDMGAVVAATDLLRETGATVLLVHHSGKDAERGARGSSAVRAAADVEIMVVGGKGGAVTISNTKQKDAPELAPISARLEPWNDSAVLVPTAPSAATAAADGGFRPTVLMGRVSVFLATRPKGESRTAIRSEVAGNKEHLGRALDVLVLEGYVVDEEGRNGGRLYRLVRPYIATEDPASDTYVEQMEAF